ncbi:MAG: glycosyltransferase [Desulfurococcaceae archaeon]
MNAYILHLFSVAGGGERVSLEIAQILRNKGFRVIYITNSSKALKRVAELLGLPGDFETIEVNSWAEKLLAHTGRFIRLRRLLLLEKGLSKLSSIPIEEDTLIIDTNTNYPFNVDISYIHYPLILPTMESKSIHLKFYDWIINHVARKMHGKPRLVLTNSAWTAKIIKDVFEIDAEVIYPPVDVDYFLYDGRKKEKIILTISRFTPEKNLHLLPRVASSLSDYEWYLVGSLGTTRSELDVSNRVLRRIWKEIKKLEIKNFHVVINLPRKELRELLLKANFYVHPMFAEHFGISIAEAISAGCIPIVYRDGGAWTDIVSPINHELGYTTLSEVHDIIRSLEKSPDKMEKLRTRSIEYSRKFKTEVFREKFINILEKYGIIK